MSHQNKHSRFTDKLSNKKFFYSSIFAMGTKAKRVFMLPVLLLILAFISADPYSTFPISNYFMDMVLWIIILWQFNRERIRNRIGLFSGDYRIVGIYIVWALIGSFRGALVADNYWEYKNWMTSSCVVLFPLCVYAFNTPETIRRTFSLWLRYAIPAFFLFFVFFITPRQQYFGPVYFLACFLPIIHKRGWKIVFVIILIFFLTYDIAGQRSQFLKALMTACIVLGCLLRRIIGDNLIRLGHASLIMLPLLLLTLGITGVFNIFADTAENQSGKYTSSKEGESDAAADTRTFIYYEVINSAIKNDYVLMGRTI